MLHFERYERGYRLRGHIDESSDFSPLPDEPIELDLSGVAGINSTGMRLWIRWKDARAAPLLLRDVPCAIVPKLSLVPAMVRGVVVCSVMAPYYDPGSDVSVERLIDADSLRAIRVTRTPPRVESPDTGQPLEFDEDEINYFGFLSSDIEIAESLQDRI